MFVDMCVCMLCCGMQCVVCGAIWRGRRCSVVCCVWCGLWWVVQCGVVRGGWCLMWFLVGGSVWCDLCACTYVHINVCIYVRTYVCIHLCVYVYKYVKSYTICSVLLRVTMLHSQREKSNSINILRQHISKVTASPGKLT